MAKTPTGRDKFVAILYVHPGQYPTGFGFTATNVELSNVVENQPEYNDIERELGRFPAPEALNGGRWSFSWEHRTLVEVPNLEADPTDVVKRADYLMYVCLDASTEMERNSYLENLVPGSPKVYGGAFVFKKTTGSGLSDDGGTAEYLHGNTGFFNQTTEVSKFTERILTPLMEAVCWHSSVSQDVDSDYSTSSTDSDCSTSSMASPIEVQKQPKVRILSVLPGGFGTHRWMFKTFNVELMAVAEYDDARHIQKDSYAPMERALGLIPDPESLRKFIKKEWSHFNWDDRMLIKIRGLPADKDGVERADYLMYICDKSADPLMPNNELLESLVNNPRQAYGAAFIFKKTTGSGEEEGGKAAEYLDSMDDDFFEEEERVTWLEESILKELMLALKYSPDRPDLASRPDRTAVMAQGSR